MDRTDGSQDERRFTELYRRHCVAVEAYVRRRARAEDVDDVVSEVFLTAWRRFGELPGAYELPWLYGVARRTLANSRRAAERRGALIGLLAERYARHESYEDEAADPADLLGLRLPLVRAFDALAEPDREVLRLTLWEELPARDAARVLGCSTATFHVRLHRARKRLRGAVERACGEPRAAVLPSEKVLVGHRGGRHG
ncbi:RNA polymerase sigma factor [Streptomyces sp. P6-2-1]|uniref:RNA polymerase sigma factor n=1 Tax=Streptomyces sp. P6-2-1 TaxID=3422591 RepID=UPI003D36C521